MNGYMEAMKTKDPAKVEAIIKANFTPEFKDIDTKGKVMTRDQTIATMKQNISSIKSFKSLKLTVGNVKVKGNQATTVEHLVIKGTLADPGNGKTMTIDVDATWNGTYVKKGGKWMCTSSKATKESVLIDGKEHSG